MIIKERKIRGIVEMQLEPNEDRRGFFGGVYDDKVFEKYEIHRNWVQKKHSLSAEKAHKIQGWYPKYDLKKGLSETVDWYKNYFGVNDNDER